MKIEYKNPNIGLYFNHKFYMSLPFFWVLATKSPLPKELQIPNWKTKKETFIIEYKEKYSKYRHEFIKGTILDLYEILHLIEPDP